MASNRNPINYNMYRCVRCPVGRWFDTIRISASGKNAQRSLQNHVATAHPDYTGNLEAMIGEQVVRQRNQRNAAGSAAGNNTQSSSTIGPAPVSTAATPQQASASPISSAQSIPYVDFLADSSNQILFANIGRAKVTKILHGLVHDESVTVGTDEWDRAAVNGQLGEEVQQLAKAAFPEDMYDHEFTVTAVSEEEVLRAMGRFYIEKALRLEARAADQA